MISKQQKKIARVSHFNGNAEQQWVYSIVNYVNTCLNWISQTPCQNEPCQNNGGCIPDFEANSYRCDCQPGFAGINCERKGKVFTDWSISEQLWISTSLVNNQHYPPPLPGGWGGDTQQSLIRGGSTPRSNPLPFYIPFLTDKVPLLYTFHWKVVPLSHTYLRTLHFFSKPLECN